MKNQNLLILGYGGFGKVVAETARLIGIYDDIHFLDDHKKENDVIGTCDCYADLQDRYTFAYPAFGDNALRMRYIEKLHHAGFVVPTFLHPQCFVSPSAVLEQGVVVLPMAVIQTGSIIRTGCLINIGAMIDHDTILEQGVHVCVGAMIKSGNRICAMEKIQAGAVVQRAPRL